MARDTTLPTGVQTATTADQYRVTNAVRIGFTTPIRVTDGPIAVTIQSESYTPGVLELSGVALGGGAADVTVRLSNLDNAVLTALRTDSPFLKSVKVYRVFWDSGGAQLTEVEIHDGLIVSFLADEQVVEIASRTAAGTSAAMAGREATIYCPYKFKGSLCGYAGAVTTCLHTLADCTAKSNQTRFGGIALMAPPVGTKIAFRVASVAPYSERSGSRKQSGTVTPVITTNQGSRTPRSVLRRGGGSTPIVPVMPGTGRLR